MNLTGRKQKSEPRVQTMISFVQSSKNGKIIYSIKDRVVTLGAG